MAATTELERLQVRKARLIKQNDLFRRELRDEAGSLRLAAEWLERGHSFYRAAAQLGGKSSTSPLRFFRRKKKGNSSSQLWKSFLMGFRVLRKLSHR